MIEEVGFKYRYKLATAARFLDCSVPQVEKLLQEGKLKAITDGVRGDRYITHTCIVKYLEEREVIGVEPKRGG